MIYILKTCFTPPRRPGTAEQAEALQELQQEVGVDFWLEPVLGRAVDIINYEILSAALIYPIMG